MDGHVIEELVQTGTLRAGINTANFLLVRGQGASGRWEGVAPDVARAIAERLGVPVSFVPFAKASLVGDAVSRDACDIALIGKDPMREQSIAFTAPYAAIEATYLIWKGGPITSMADVDQPGVRIAVGSGSAYDLWLTRNIVHAELVRASSVAASISQFVDQRLEVLAGLKPGLLLECDRVPETRILDGHFTTVNQAVGTARRHASAIIFLKAFVEEIKSSGSLGQMIEHNAARGLSVAEPDS